MCLRIADTNRVDYLFVLYLYEGPKYIVQVSGLSLNVSHAINALRDRLRVDDPRRASASGAPMAYSSGASTAAAAQAAQLKQLQQQQQLGLMQPQQQGGYSSAPSLGAGGAPYRSAQPFAGGVQFAGAAQSADSVLSDQNVRRTVPMVQAASGAAAARTSAQQQADYTYFQTVTQAAAGGGAQLAVGSGPGGAAEGARASSSSTSSTLSGGGGAAAAIGSHGGAPSYPSLEKRDSLTNSVQLLPNSMRGAPFATGAGSGASSK